MIIEYHRPQTLDEALQLMTRTSPPTYAMGGGTVLNRPSPNQYAVVDLQTLDFDHIRKRGNSLEIGATVTLHALQGSSDTTSALKRALNLEGNYNLRQLATVAGTLVACNGRSPFATVMLALDAKLTVVNGSSSVVVLGDLLPLREQLLRGKLITTITIPLNVKLAFESVARTPADRPIVCAAVVRWPGGRTRAALGGWGKSPLLAMDGPSPTGAEIAARSVFHEAADESASAEYRSEIAATLVMRCMDQIEVNQAG